MRKNAVSIVATHALFGSKLYFTAPLTHLHHLSFSITDLPPLSSPPLSFSFNYTRKSSKAPYPVAYPSNPVVL